MEKNTKVLMALMGMDIGGAETHIVELCRALVRMGMSVYVVSNGGVYEQTLKDCGVTIFRAPLKTKSVASIIASYNLLKRIIIENNIRLVHAHARIPAFVCGRLFNSLKNTPHWFRFVTTVHGAYSTAPIYKLLTNWGEKTIAVSDDLKEYLTKNYRVPERNIFMTVNGIDVSAFSPETPCADNDFSPTSFKIINVSRMDETMTAPAHALLNLAEKLSSLGEIEVILVGDGDDFANISRRAETVNKKLGKQMFRVLGRRTDVPKLLAAADVFVGVSRAAMEAMSTGLPVILGGSPRVFQGYCGIFKEDKLAAGISTNFCFRGFPAITDDALFADIKELFNATEEERRALGAFGRKTIVNHYSVEKMAGDVIAVYELLRASLNRRVLISGYYGSNNHGDDALLKAITDDLRTLAPDIKITVISKRPKETKQKYGVDAIAKFDLLGIYRKLKRCGLLISGGGTLIQDLTSARSLYYYLRIMNAAIKINVPVMLYANGIGPLLREKSKEAAKKTLEQSSLITLRDADSLDTLKALGVNNPNVVLTADAAFGMKIKDEKAGERLLSSLGLNRGEYICVAVRSWKYLKPDFSGEIAAFCSRTMDKWGLKTVFVPMQKTLDLEACKAVGAGVSGSQVLNEALSDEFCADELLYVCANAAFLAGMRLHSLVYALKSGVPAIGLVYDPKVRAVMEMFSQPYFADVSDLKAETINRFADEIMARREEISWEINKTAAALAEKAFLNAEYAVKLLNGEDL